MHREITRLQIVLGSTAAKNMARRRFARPEEWVPALGCHPLLLDGGLKHFMTASDLVSGPHSGPPSRSPSRARHDPGIPPWAVSHRRCAVFRSPGWHALVGTRRIRNRVLRAIAGIVLPGESLVVVEATGRRRRRSRPIPAHHRSTIRIRDSSGAWLHRLDGKLLGNGANRPPWPACRICAAGFGNFARTRVVARRGRCCRSCGSARLSSNAHGGIWPKPHGWSNGITHAAEWLLGIF